VNLRSATLGSVVLASAALAFAGCSGSGSAGSPAAGSAAGNGPGVATTTVDLPPSYRFAPSAISVKAGSAVTWTNHDNFTHSVQFLDGGLPTEPQVMQPGQSTNFTFATAGTYHYQCHLHPQNMKGTVTVTP
jgi:plastocyanin